MATDTLEARDDSAKTHSPEAIYAPDDMPDVYGSILHGDCMEPHYREGECLVFSKLEKPANGDLVGFWLHPDNLHEGEPERWVKRLVSCPVDIPFRPHPSSELEPLIIFEMTNPRKLLAVHASCVTAMHRVIGVAEPDGTGMAYMKERPRGEVATGRDGPGAGVLDGNAKATGKGSGQ